MSDSIQVSLVSKPIFTPIGITFSPDVPQGGGVVNGFVAANQVATTDTTLMLTSLNPLVFTPQRTAVIKKGTTTTAISAVYNPLPNGPSVVGVFASIPGGGSTPITPVVLIPQVHVGTVEGGDDATPCDIDYLTYPDIPQDDTFINGKIKITAVAPHGGCLIYVQSDTGFFVPPPDGVLIKEGCDHADVPTSIVPQTSAFTAHVGAQNADFSSSFGPIPVDVPAKSH